MIKSDKITRQQNMRTRKQNTERNEKIVKMFNAGKTWQEIASECNVSRATVYRVVERSGGD